MSGNNPATLWFFKDWETDQGLRLCSLAAQGLWMRMLCIAAKHDPMGYVAVAGRPLKTREVSRLIGSTEAEVEMLLAELKTNDVFSVDRLGRIYNRRMVRGNKSRANGAKGQGEHTSDKIISSGNQKEKNKQGGLGLCGTESRSLGVLEEEERKSEFSLHGGASNEAWTNGGFEQFWEHYPNKVGKADARKYFDKVGRSRAVTFAAMMAGLEQYVHKTDDRPWCNPSTWLNQHRWLDKPARVQPKGNGNGRTVQDAAADLHNAVRRFDEPAPSDIRDREGANVIRLLPQG